MWHQVLADERSGWCGGDALLGLPMKVALELPLLPRITSYVILGFSKSECMERTNCERASR
jgi:hypothetical protein